MKSLRVFSGNRLDFLADQLAGLLTRNPPPSPFGKEIILVQSLGMERWLSIQLAARMGICANCRFDFPNAFIREICKVVLPEVRDTPLFEPRYLAWRIMELLPGYLDDPRFSRLKTYLGTPLHSLKLLQLSERIANTFDQYTVYRPEFIFEWELSPSPCPSHKGRGVERAGRPAPPQGKEYEPSNPGWQAGKPAPHEGGGYVSSDWGWQAGKPAPKGDKEYDHSSWGRQGGKPALDECGTDDDWQAVLWRGLSAGHEDENRAVLGRMLLSRLDRAASERHGIGSGRFGITEAGESPKDLVLPHRISVFGISYLPPFHIQVLQSLSRLTEVNLFLLNPCREYWGDIRPERQIGRMAFKSGNAGLSAEDLYFESGNALLASMGKLGREFFELITSVECEEYPFFEDPGGSDLLSRIRSDILNLSQSAEIHGGPVEVSSSDRSVEIHSCHSPMREVEVLYDHLLEMFENVPSLSPGDIVVMAPDIETYAPLVQAVFDAPGDEKMRIPYNIADRSVSRESTVINAFLSILDLWGERITASKVLGVLESEPVRRRFEISDKDLDLIVKWVVDVRIRWGIDEKERLKWCRTAFHENTWMAGIDRLLLGYALPGRDRRTFSGILPYDNLEGSETLVLGSFLAFLDSLFKHLESIDRPRGLAEWEHVLLEMLSDFLIQDDDSRDDIHALRRAVGDLQKIQEVSGFSGELDQSVIKWYMSRFAKGESFGRGFLTGGVTFCSMLPMRSIPFKVVCLIGMNENAFPRQAKPVEFDLMAKNSRPGDRSQRDDDRYLFLEALISAESRLYISYTGQSSRDNSPMPPSVLVSELVDYIQKNFTCKDNGNREWFLTQHRLQPFNPAYFAGERKLFSYSRDHLAQACSMMREKRDPVDFIAEKLPPAEGAMRTVSIADLCRFFANPARFMLNRRLGIYLREENNLLDDAECFEMGKLEEYSLTSDLISHALAGVRPADRFEITQAAGVLPHGIPGKNLFSNLSRDIEMFLSRTGSYLESGRLDPLGVDMPAGAFRIVGTIEPVYRDRFVQFRYASIKAKDLLNTWIAHLLLNASDREGYHRESIVIGGKSDEWEAFRFHPVNNAMELVMELLDLYWEGLTKPLRFFPETSLAYAKAVLESKPGEDPLRTAAKKWDSGFNFSGEGADIHIAFCFRSGSPLDKEFEATSLSVFGPLIGSREKV